MLKLLPVIPKMQSIGMATNTTAQWILSTRGPAFGKARRLMEVVLIGSMKEHTYRSLQGSSGALKQVKSEITDLLLDHFSQPHVKSAQSSNIKTSITKVVIYKNSLI